MNSSVDQAELDKFEAMAAEWWDPAGKFKPLHGMNPVRLDYVTDQIAQACGRERKGARPFAGLRVLDIGCGGGLLSEPLARLGAEVLGADAVARNIEVARLHAAQMGLEIDYRATTAEALAAAGEAFDAVLALEIIEHVEGPAEFVATCASLARPGGAVIVSTLNRTPQSFAMAIVGAEWVMRWLPKGTHDWRRFITPAELETMMSAAGLQPVDQRGMQYNPLTGDWRLSSSDFGCNYIATALRPAN
ncbi:bifunctional 2-polyprenyl-6-hydroxyphenol methylase/3-demethylubiquinol 3-O-methyltransferase UbiG [Paracoccus suum]|uniref:Ubiquinone biosynthesis O-methyltransferase n=1 Tax=Paracoccus suum TaxID=2259340 RepID=A0A344PGN4_9RHOB|nr:bifunctional 2-polyprenyl-6-hydroxyphenol methylase/3-demethylubiquinol 3-O-methyltransferase UbiG [Paracoccus suum]AXC48539.1 bifunctional 2-polyprenyl-6-hydroxyphenol methylase/3-demethylubiquinol 3-O-methyltransferase UbiG [Paracoccus suum]